MKELDKVVHEPARLQIMTLLSGVEWADFVSLCLTLGLTRGNLSAHSSRLEQRGYVMIDPTLVQSLDLHAHDTLHGGMVGLRSEPLDRARPGLRAGR